MAPAFLGRLQRGAVLCSWTLLLLSRAAEGRHLAQTFSPSPFGSGACPPFTAADFSTSSSPCQVCMIAGSTLQVGTNPSTGCTNHVPGGVPQQHITYGAAAPALPAGPARRTPRRTRLASRCAAGRGLAAALAACFSRDRAPRPSLAAHALMLSRDRHLHGANGRLPVQLLRRLRAFHILSVPLRKLGDVGADASPFSAALPKIDYSQPALTYNRRACSVPAGNAV